MKTSFPWIAQVSYFSILGCKIYTPQGVFATPGDMACLVCFVNQLFINLSIPSITPCVFSPQTVQQCWCLLTSFIPYITMQFLIKTYRKVYCCKIYTPQGVFATPGDMACLVCFVNQLFINLGIPLIMPCVFSPQTVQQCWCLLTSFIPYITMHFLIKTYRKVYCYLLYKFLDLCTI